MFDNISEITTLIDEKEKELSDLFGQMEEDFVNLYGLSEYNAESGYESYTSSAPRNFFDKVVEGANRSDISIQIKLPDDANEKERRAASVGEQYLWGALDQINRNFRGSEPPLREQIAFMECLRGWVAVRALVYAQKDKTVFDVLIWDILHTTWEKGKNGNVWAARKAKLTKAQILSEYGLAINGKDATLIDWFDEERNSIIIDNAWAKKPKAHKIGHCPVGIFSVGSMPTMQTQKFESTLQFRGHSVWAASRGLYEPFNKIVSRTMDIYERSRVGSIIHKSKDGKAALPDGADPFRTFEEIKLSEDETIEPLKLPPAPPETAVLHSIISRDLEQSTIPYPISTQAQSGAALSILVEGTRSVYSPKTSTMEQTYTWLCEELLGQFNERISKKTTIRGFTPDGKFFTMQIKPKEVDPGWYIVVSAKPKLPRDRQMEIFMAKAATDQRPGQQPLYSMRTAREEIAPVRDPDAEQDKIYVEKGLSLEPIMIANIAIALKEAGKDKEAQQILMLLQPPGAGAGPGAGPGAGAPQVPPELLAAAVEALQMNPQTAPLAQAIMQAMQGGQGAPAGGAPGTTGGPPGQQPPPTGV